MREKNELPLFIISDCSNLFAREKIYKYLCNKAKSFLMVDGTDFCNIPLDPRYYREVWSSICCDISYQINRSIVLCAAITPDMVESFIHRYFSEVFFLIIVSDEETLLNRIKKANINNKDHIKSAILRNRWLLNNAEILYPSIELLNISKMKDEDVVTCVEQWIFTQMNMTTTK